MSTEKRFNAWLPDFGAKGWGITGVCFVFFIFFSFWNSVTNTLFGMFSEQFGWQQTDMSYVITVAGWISLIAVVLFGTLGRRFGARIVSAVGLVGSAAGFALLATMASFEQFVAGVVVFCFSMVAYGTIGVGQLGARWFPHTKGAFMGIATIGMTFSSAALNPIILAFMGAGLGVSGFFWAAAAVCVVMAVVVFLFVKDNPEEAGAYPDNDRSIIREQLDAEFRAAEEYRRNSPWTTARVLATPQTWLIGLGTGIPMMVGAGVIALLVPTLAAFGQDPMFGVVLLSSMWPIGLLGHYLIGVLDQKVGTKKTALTVICVLGIGGLICWLGGANTVLCAIATGMFMFGLSGAANMCMSLTGSIFGRADFDVAYTPIQVIFNVLNFAGVSVMSTIAAAFGATNVMIAVAALCAVAFAIILALPYKQIASHVN
ncbi:MAG: MFS transporter [Collinsella sp.]|nr:MFS transporter [Collinsella sp.]